MDINTSIIANTIHVVSTFFGLQTDFEWQILICLNNPTEDRKEKLNDLLEVLQLKIKDYDKSQHKVFWKTVMNVIEKATLMMTSGLNMKMKPPSVTKEIRKSESQKDVRLVLSRTNLQCPVPFWFAVPELFDNIVLKIGEGSFADVYQIEKHSDEDRILKIIPVGEPIPNSEFIQLSFKETTAEIYVSQELSMLPGGKYYSCSTFPSIYKVSVVQDVFPEAATRAWKRYYSYKRSSFHPCPNVYPADQAYITIESEIAGIDMDSFKIEKYCIALSIFQQVATGIAVAEKKLQFEHRDLHPGNILLKRYSEEALPITLRSKKYSIKTYGVKASIIDFTYSRLTTDEGTRYLDLDQIYDPKPKSTKKFLDHRFVYSKMAEITEKNWKKFCPKTNILWLKHIVECILYKMQEQRTRPSGRLERMAKICLNIHNRTILSYSSAFEFVQKEVLLNEFYSQ